VSNLTLEKWKPEAYALEQYLDQLPAPLAFLVGEAVDVGWFCELFWEPEVGADGIEIRPGLCSAERPRLFERRIGTELLELQEALQAANVEYRLIAQGGEDEVLDRALFVLNELQEVLMYLAYEDPKAVDVERLNILRALYADAATHSDVASALQNFGTFAAMHYPEVQGLGGFDALLIKEGFALSRKLRRRALEQNEAPDRETQAALQLRNRIATLLCERLQRARRVIRFALRNHVDLIQRVTSPHHRSFRAEVNHSMIRDLGGMDERETPEDVAL